MNLEMNIDSHNLRRSIDSYIETNDISNELPSAFNYMFDNLIYDNHKKVLIIEDDVDMAVAISFFIETNSPEYKCTIATDAYEALDSLCENKFDLVLADENIPGLKGSQTINEMDSFINRDPTLCASELFSERVPVIIMSGTEKSISQKGFIDKIHSYKNFEVVDVLTKRNLLPYLFANFLKQKVS